MKSQSPFIQAMDDLRPRSARRTIILQRILAARQPVLPLRQWRWALAGVPAMVVLALGLAWSLGAYDATRTPVPDKVARAVAVAPTHSAHAYGTAAVYLTRITAETNADYDLPKRVALLSMEPVQLTDGDIDTLITALKNKGWTGTSILPLMNYPDGGYSLGAGHSSKGVANLAAQLLQDSGLLALLQAKGLNFTDVTERLNSRWPYYVANLAGSNLRVPGYFEVFQGQENGAQGMMLLIHSELLGEVDAVPLAQALKSAFFLPDDGAAITADQAINVTHADLFYMEGVPYYGFYVDQDEKGMNWAYALAVDRSALDAVPELAVAYERLLAGEPQNAVRVSRLPDTKALVQVLDPNTGNVVATVTDPNTNK